LGNLYTKHNQRKIYFTNEENKGQNGGGTLDAYEERSGSDSFNTSEEESGKGDQDDEYMVMMVIDQSVLTSIFSTMVLKQLHDEMSLLRKFPFM